MTLHLTRIAVACIAVGVLLASLGCTKKVTPKPPTSAAVEKPTVPITPTPKPAPSLPTNPSSPIPTPTSPVAPALPSPLVAGQVDAGSLKTANDFLKAFGEGNASDANLTPAFARAIGKPIVFDSDKARGYSSDEVKRWLRKVGSGLTFGPPTGFSGSGMSFLSGTFQGPNRTGRYLLRLAPGEGGLKVDWIELSSAKLGPVVIQGTEAPFLEFAAKAFLDAAINPASSAAEGGGLPLLAGSMTPHLRDFWAKPFQGDRDQGFDFNRLQLQQQLQQRIGSVESYTIAQNGTAPEFRIELTKAGGEKKVFLLKLVKGEAPGLFLVDAFDPQ